MYVCCVFNLPSNCLPGVLPCVMFLIQRNNNAFSGLRTVQVGKAPGSKYQLNLVVSLHSKSVVVTTMQRKTLLMYCACRLCWHVMLCQLKDDKFPPPFQWTSLSSSTVWCKRGREKSSAGSVWIIFLNTYDASNFHTDLSFHHYNDNVSVGRAYVGFKSRAVPHCKQNPHNAPFMSINFLSIFDLLWLIITAEEVTAS